MKDSAPAEALFIGEDICFIQWAGGGGHIKINCTEKYIFVGSFIISQGYVNDVFKPSVRLFKDTVGAEYFTNRWQFSL